MACLRELDALTYLLVRVVFSRGLEIRGYFCRYGSGVGLKINSALGLGLAV